MEPTNKVGHGHDLREDVNGRSFPCYLASSAVDAVDVEGDCSITGGFSHISRNGYYVDTISLFEVGASIVEIIASLRRKDILNDWEEKVMLQ